MNEFDSVVRDVLTRSFPEKAIVAQRAFTRAGMSPEELVRLYELTLQTRAVNALEIGMGSGTSTVVMLSALSETGGRLTSIDPFQTSSFSGTGQKVVREAGHADSHRLIEKPDYLALPQLLETGERFDLILIDGYHSFDYTLLDIFYADLLLETAGILAVHDSSWPAVLKALRFLEAQKPYVSLSPPPFIRHTSILRKSLRRMRIYFSGRGLVTAFNERRRNWHTLVAYRKLSDRMAPEFELGF